MRSAVVFLGVAVGESVPRFDIVMALIGGTLTGPLVFVLPPLMYIRARALKERTGGPATTPEVFSSSERRSVHEISSDPRIHSQSVYYGFPDGNTNPNRYSYVYYDDNDPSSELSDLEDIHREGSSKDDLKLTRRQVDDRPVFLEASRITQRRRRVISVEAPGMGRFWNLRMMRDCFGYLVVILGILITISSTYINIKNTIRFVRFTPPCIFNVSAAFAALNITQT